MLHKKKYGSATFKFEHLQYKCTGTHYTHTHIQFCHLHIINNNLIVSSKNRLSGNIIIP